MRGFDNKWTVEACTIADALLKQAKIEQTDHSYLPMYLPDAPFREWQLRKKLERKPASQQPSPATACQTKVQGKLTEENANGQSNK